MTDESSMSTPATPVFDKLAALYRRLLAPDQVVELRAVGVQRGSGKPHVEAGFFDTAHLPDMAKAALDLTKVAKGVYFTLNPLNPALLARRCNRTAWANEGELAKDKDVLARRWLLVDADPARDPLVSATDAEKAEAMAVAFDVREHLRGRGWPDPVLADSGNGYHLLYRVDLPAADMGAVERVLRALAAKFDTPRVKIDQTVFNPARICKLPGTLARKGDSTPDRPHRRARIVEYPTPDREPDPCPTTGAPASSPPI
jgi:hypothetical protein